MLQKAKLYFSKHNAIIGAIVGFSLSLIPASIFYLAIISEGKARILCIGGLIAIFIVVLIKDFKKIKFWNLFEIER